VLRKNAFMAELHSRIVPLVRTRSSSERAHGALHAASELPCADALLARWAPQVVDNEAFWCRYFFRLHALRLAHAPPPDAAAEAAAAAVAAAAAADAAASAAPQPEAAAEAAGCVRVAHASRLALR
jgi:hypothetical protein